MSTRRRIPVEQGRQPVLLSFSRTPFGDYGGSLVDLSAADLANHVKSHAILRAGINAADVDAIILGQIGHSPYSPDLARLIALDDAQTREQVPGWTVDMQCASGMVAIQQAMASIIFGAGEVYLPVGVESMSNTDYVIDGSGRFTSPYYRGMSFLGKYIKPLKIAAKFGRRPLVGMIDDGLLPKRLRSNIALGNMAMTAELLAIDYDITREAQDAWSLRSHERALAAMQSYFLQGEIDPISDGSALIMVDEHPRASSLKSLARLKPVNGTKNVTAGNSSPLSDGAAAGVVTSWEYAQSIGQEPLAVLTDYCLVACDPERMGISPAFAIKKLLDRNGLPLSAIGRLQINEAFAAQTVACVRELELDENRLNVNGGAIAYGHPIGCSGLRIVGTLARELLMSGQEWGIAAICARLGQGAAILVRNPRIGGTR